MGVTEAFARQAGTGHCVTGRLGPAGKPGPFMPGARIQHRSAATEDAGVLGVSLQLDYSLVERGNEQNFCSCTVSLTKCRRACNGPYSGIHWRSDPYFSPIPGPVLKQSSIPQWSPIPASDAPDRMSMGGISSVSRTLRGGPYGPDDDFPAGISGADHHHRHVGNHPTKLITRTRRSSFSSSCLCRHKHCASGGIRRGRLSAID